MDDGGLLAVDEDGNGWRLPNADSFRVAALTAANLWVLRTIDEFGDHAGGRTTRRWDDSIERWRNQLGGDQTVHETFAYWPYRMRCGSQHPPPKRSGSAPTQDKDWSLHNNGLDDLAEGNGGPPDGIHYFNLGIENDRWLLGSFEGLYWKNLADEHWNQAELDIIPRVRTLQWLDNGRLLVGAYGGGVYRGTPGKKTGMKFPKESGWSYPKQVVAADSDGDEFWVVSGSAAVPHT